jgi:tetratricopeptide (TPR) repeat protein
MTLSFVSTEAAEPRMQSGANSEMSFVQRRLPWIIGGAALFFYLCTMARWVTYAGLPALARVAGWMWQPVFSAPLHFLLTYPIRWLPVGWQVVGLNLFSALCSGLTLALLARSVALLPHDRTRDQRHLERSDYSLLSIPVAWVPPVLAVLVCGLQMTFWENAIADTGESLDLLLFAYVIRCLLEFRIDQRQSWLTRMALVYGIGMTNNFAMIGFLPLLVMAVVWMKGTSFFNLKFIVRMALWGLAGLSLYLVLPAIQTIFAQSDLSFWKALRTLLGLQKNTLLSFPRYIIALVGLTSLVPVLFMGIKWPASFGDISPVGSALTNLMMHVIHGLFLVACLAVAFDPPFSPRQLGLGYPMLTFYYLGALAIGYCGGYFLLIFGHGAKLWPRPSMLRSLLNHVVNAFVWVALIAVPAGLIYMNWPQIRAASSPYLDQFAITSAKLLKEFAPKGGIVLGDEPLRLYALEAALNRSGSRKDYVLVDTASMPRPAYHRRLSQKHPEYWPNYLAQRTANVLIDSATLVDLLARLAESHPIYYLHPSFGYYFEYFQIRPRNLLYQLSPYPTNSLTGPALTAEEIKENDQFWQQMKSDLSPLLRTLNKPAAPNNPLRPQRTQPAVALMGQMYSRALDYFGVELQKAGQLERAAEYYEESLKYNSENAAAFVNLDYNRILRAGQRANPAPSEGAKKRLQVYGGNWNYILSLNGPVDEPNLCYRLAETFGQGQNYRQSGQQLQRVHYFDPDLVPARFALIPLYTRCRMPNKALELIAETRANSPGQKLDQDQDLALLQYEAWAYAARNELPRAEEILRSAQKQHPSNNDVFTTLSEIYQKVGNTNNALAVLKEQMTLQPQNPSPLINYAALKLRTGNYQEAIPLLDSALSLQPNNQVALFNRAIAYLQLGKLDEAQRDYETVQSLLGVPVYGVAWGLHEVAYRKRDRNSAIRHGEAFLKLAPTGSPESNTVKDRLKKLKKGLF